MRLLSKRVVVLSTFLFITVLPTLFAQAALVPECLIEGGCQLCNLVNLGNNIIRFAILGVGVPMTALVTAWAGFLYMTAGGNPQQITRAHGMFKKVAIGFIIVMTSWLVVDLVMRNLLSAEYQGFGPWNKIQCIIPPPDDEHLDEYFTSEGELYCPPGETENFVGGFNTCLPEVEATFNPKEGTAIHGPRTGVCRTGQVPSEIDAVLIREAQAAGLDPALVRGLMATESNFITNASSRADAHGLMQLQPDTAKETLPSAFAGMNQQQIRDVLKSDWRLNIHVGVVHYRILLHDFNNNESLALAAYNGGPGANAMSEHCPGLYAWQCLYDGFASDGSSCYNTGSTGCLLNERSGHPGFGETRRYVPRVQANKAACDY